MSVCRACTLLSPWLASHPPPPPTSRWPARTMQTARHSNQSIKQGKHWKCKRQSYLSVDFFPLTPTHTYRIYIDQIADQQKNEWVRSSLFCWYRTFARSLLTLCFFPAPPGNVGVPIKLLFEAEGMKVTVEVRRRVTIGSISQLWYKKNAYPHSSFWLVIL